MSGKRKQGDLWYQAYQIAGDLILTIQSDLTEGQRERLGTLLLDVLSDPDRYTADVVRSLRELAVKP